MKSDRVKLPFEYEEIKESFVSWNDNGGIDIEMKFSEQLTEADKLSLRSCIGEALMNNNALKYFNKLLKREVKFINLIEI